MGRPEIPGWVAPEGRPCPELALGGRVRVTHTLVDGEPLDASVVSPIAWRGWRREELDAYGDGIVVGLRWPYSGPFKSGTRQASAGFSLEPPEFEPAYRQREVTHRAVLVAVHLFRKHLVVLSDDVEKL